MMLPTWVVPILLVLGVRGGRVVLVVVVISAGGAVGIVISGGLLPVGDTHLMPNLLLLQ